MATRHTDGTHSACHFCGSTAARKQGRTSRAKLLAEYHRMFGISFPPAVLESSFGFDEIREYRCETCRTIHYAPSVCGDAAYYSHLSKNLSWYYDPTRWEYRPALDILRKEGVGTFLEVGCGAGHFLRLARQQRIEGHGYEIEPESIRRLEAEGFRVVSDLKGPLGQYRAILLFQVLEHLLDPFDCLTSLSSHVTAGGFFLLSTPVTPSGAAFSGNAFLRPPHHQWLPTAAGYQRLAGRLGMTCETLMYEPPDVSQLEYGLRKRYELDCGLGRLPKARALSRQVLRVGKALGCEWARVGHTVFALFRKN
jgi:SAM-dependent methyltransferase